MCRGKEDVHNLVLFACLSIHSVGWVRGRERASRVCRRVERVDSVFACSMCARERERITCERWAHWEEALVVGGAAVGRVVGARDDEGAGRCRERARASSPRERCGVAPAQLWRRDRRRPALFVEKILDLDDLVVFMHRHPRVALAICKNEHRILRLTRCEDALAARVRVRQREAQG